MQLEGMASSAVPSRIRHPFHPHDLVLVPTPLPNFTVQYCSACWHPLSGFHYHCSTPGCWFNLHLSCASMPFTLSLPYLHPLHPYPHHSFSLLFFAPYENGLFICNLCGSCVRRPLWLYKCNTCRDFDVHLGCAIHAQQCFLPQQYHLPRFSNDHRQPIRSTGGRGMNYSRLGRTIMSTLIQASVPQLIGIGLNASPLQDVGSSFFSDFSQLFQSLPSTDSFFTF